MVRGRGSRKKRERERERTPDALSPLSAAAVVADADGDYHR
jgi:tellurite resistance protein